MPVPAEIVRAMFEMLHHKTQILLEHQGFDDLANELGDGMSQKFLYEKFNDAHKREEVTFRASKLQVILTYLGFRNLKQLELAIKHPISKILLSCEGVWCSYVRQHSDNGIIFQSPVEISRDGGKMIFTLRGPSATYKGEVVYRNGCLITTFDNANGKQFHHVYKIGNRANPKVLQGTYSGMSTANDPIGGRAVLSRADRAFAAIENQEMRIGDLLESTDEKLQSLGLYFQEYTKNNLTLNKVVTFGWGDLK